MRSMPGMNQQQVRFALQTLLRFAAVVTKNRTLPQKMAQRIEEHAVTLLAQMERDERSPEDVAEELNRLISVLNLALPPHPEGISFPPFQSATVRQAKSGVVSFELYLNQLLRGGYLPLQEEGQLFEEAMILWRDIGILLSPKEGMQQLTELIDKLNRAQSEGEYPSPDSNAYGA